MVHELIPAEAYRGETLLSSPHDGKAMPLHIVSTHLLADGHVLARYSNGSGAIFEEEELEKLRPVPKKILATAPDPPIALPTLPVRTDASSPVVEAEQPLVLRPAAQAG